jgi:hypothetical protein
MSAARALSFLLILLIASCKREAPKPAPASGGEKKPAEQIVDQGDSAKGEQAAEAGDGESPSDIIGTLGGNAAAYVVVLDEDPDEVHNDFDESGTIEATHGIGIEVLEGSPENPDSTYLTLLTWRGEVDKDNPRELTAKAEKNDLKLYREETELAHFVYVDEHLFLSPALRKRIVKGLDRPDSTLQWHYLRMFFNGESWPDKHIAQVVELRFIRDSIESGNIESSLGHLEEMSAAASDDTISRYCKHLSDSLKSWKKAAQPLTLVDARKLGRLLADPSYPPLDTPTVFWQDTLLCVVQEGKPSKKMRTYNPRSRKWGAEVPVRYPETGLSKLFESENSVSDRYETCKVCWHPNFGPQTEERCAGLPCDPLIMLNTPPGGSVENREDLVRAGGSCAAGHGALEFGGGGQLFQTSQPDLEWVIFPNPPVYAYHGSTYEDVRQYPVVVSPDQDWVAYALTSKDGNGRDLWVGRLKYKP